MSRVYREVRLSSGIVYASAILVPLTQTLSYTVLPASYRCRPISGTLDSVLYYVWYVLVCSWIRLFCKGLITCSACFVASSIGLSSWNGKVAAVDGVVNSSWLSNTPGPLCSFLMGFGGVPEPQFQRRCTGLLYLIFRSRPILGQAEIQSSSTFG